jgi:hypothetical protein
LKPANELIRTAFLRMFFMNRQNLASKLNAMEEPLTPNDGRAVRRNAAGEEAREKGVRREEKGVRREEKMREKEEIRNETQPGRPEKVAACGWVFGMIISDRSGEEDLEKSADR